MLLEVVTYRFHPHTSDDDDRTYRTREEVEEAKRNDPIVRFGGYLKEQGLLDDERAEQLRAELKSEVDQAVDKAWNAPDPDPESALDHVFADRRAAAHGARPEGGQPEQPVENEGTEATPSQPSEGLGGVAGPEEHTAEPNRPADPPIESEFRP